MKDEMKELAKHRLSRAKEAFQESAMLFEKESYRGTVNRLYHAAFYAPKALLATKGFDSSKHSGVIALFHEHFVKPNTVDVEKAKALSRSFEERQDSDYEDFASVERHQAELIKKEVKEFVDECERILLAILGA